METRISTKGQVVLPQAVRKKLNFQPGDHLTISVEGERVILTPRKRRRFKARIIKDSLTGLPVLTAGPDAPKLTNEQVADMLADSP